MLVNASINIIFFPIQFRDSKKVFSFEELFRDYVITFLGMACALSGFYVIKKKYPDFKKSGYIALGIFSSRNFNYFSNKYFAI